MRTLHQAVKLLCRGSVALAVITTMALTCHAQPLSGSSVELTGALPEVRFLGSSTGASQWEIEGFSNMFEISRDGELSGLGFFGILPDAIANALTLRGGGIVVGSNETSTERLSVVGDGMRASMELIPQFGQNANARIVAEDGPNTIAIEATGINGGGFEQFFKASLDAPEDSLTVLENGQVRAGKPFSDAASLTSADMHIGGSGLLIDTGFSSYKLSSLTTGNAIFGIQRFDPGATFDPVPFFISSNALTSSLVIGGADDGGNIGMGTSDPDASLHIFDITGSARLLVEEASTTVADRALMRLTNNGPSRIEMNNTDSGRTWTLLADFNNQFQIRQNGPNTANFAIRGDGTFSFNNGGQSVMALLPTGNLRIAGVLTEQSDRNSKENIEKVNAGDVLAKVIDLPVSKWNYIDDESDSSHVGPMAQDFHEAFGLGDDDKSIATLDTSGVALAAIQGLNEKLEAKNGEVEDLQDRIERLEKLVEALSAQ